MDRVTVNDGAVGLLERRSRPDGRLGAAGWVGCHPARDEAGLTDMVLLGLAGLTYWSDSFRPTMADIA
ncbi:hypothetical protein GCM10027290_26870 [Micromonospora sonneratiae]